MQVSRSQLQLLGLHDEIIVDLFAGGGGASTGIEAALGRQVDVAINHSPAAVAMHEANHPQTRHYRSDVFEVDPWDVVRAFFGRLVGLLWMSPDCTYYSKSRGGKPIRFANKKRRALAWIALRWAGTVRPRVIILENVEEFLGWGPLVAKRDRDTGRVVRADGTVAEAGERVPVQDQDLLPDGRRTGKTFRRFVRELRALGYVVEWKNVRACDFGAPTTRTRLFLVARCDGRPIVWPEPTHAPKPKARAVGLRPYRAAAECIDWSLPMCSIFADREEARAFAAEHGVGVPVRPLAEATMARVARGFRQFVLDAPEPFIVGNNTNNVPRPVSGPLVTITTGGRHLLVAPTLVQTGYGERPAANGRKGQYPRALDIEAPLGAVVGTGKHALVAAFLSQHNAGFYVGAGRDLREPSPTICASGSPQSLVAAHLVRQYGTGGGADVAEPLRTIPTGGKHALVYAFLVKYYGQGVGQSLTEPCDTITTRDRFGLVTVQVNGVTYVVDDIALRMLQPRELYSCQGFPVTYQIDRASAGTGGAGGRRFTKTEQGMMVGNSVSPPPATALVAANVPELRSVATRSAGTGGEARPLRAVARRALAA